MHTREIIIILSLIVLISGCTISMESSSGQSASGSASSTTSSVTSGSSEAATGILYISSVPSGATVYVGRALVGVTPVSVELTSGAYTVTIEKDGYYDYSGRVQVLSDSRNIVSAVLTVISEAEEEYVPPNETIEETPPSEEETPPPTPVGALMIDSSPNGASVYINEIYYGLTPKIISPLIAAEYTVTVDKEGYYLNSTQIRVNANILTPYTFILVTMPVEPEGLLRCNLTINSDPAAAVVYFNDSAIGTTPFSALINHGYYSMRFVKQNYYEYNASKQVDCIDETFSVNLTELPS